MISWTPPFSLPVTNVAILIFYDVEIGLNNSVAVFQNLTQPFITANTSNFTCGEMCTITVSITPINSVGRGEVAFQSLTFSAMSNGSFGSPCE